MHIFIHKIYNIYLPQHTYIVANSLFKQRSLLPTSDPGESEELLQRLIDQKGIADGFGITFSFQQSDVCIEFARPLRIVFGCDWNEIKNNVDEAVDIIDEHEKHLLELDSVTFDQSRFHQKSMTFHGKIAFANPVCIPSNRISVHRTQGIYFYDELHCLLYFSDNGNYIRRGKLQWKFTNTSREEFPLDGKWEVQNSSGESEIIFVQRHFFSAMLSNYHRDSNYHIVIDENDCIPRLVNPNMYDRIRQIGNKAILPGSTGPGLGEILEWKNSGAELIKWKRLTANLDDCWRESSFKAGNFVYRKCNVHPHNDQKLGPVYQAEHLWGNTFCQGFCVGMASYHFLQPDSSGNYSAYISYESPRTEAWPSLDNGEPVPSRVPFRNIQWESESRTFKAEIPWEQDYGTTWMNESLWQYEITFDQSYMFVVSGTVRRSTGEPHKFGVDLIYINAALATPLYD